MLQFLNHKLKQYFVLPISVNPSYWEDNSKRRFLFHDLSISVESELKHEHWYFNMGIFQNFHYSEETTRNKIFSQVSYKENCIKW